MARRSRNSLIGFHTGLTDKHAQFKNLDPFRVLVLDTDATPDDIKNRYKKMSVLCHPDKNGGSDQAKQAFEAVKDAYARLSDEKKRDRTILVIEGARERCRQERAFKLSKGVDPATLPPEEEALQKEVAKTFAPVHKSNCRGASPPLNHDLYAIDATPARWRGREGLLLSIRSAWPRRRRERT